MRQRKYFIFAFIFAVLAAGAVYLYLDSLRAEQETVVEYFSVPVVKEKIAARTIITADMLVIEQMIAAQIHPDALLEEEHITGSTASASLFPGEQFLQQRLVAPGEKGAGLAYIISPGKRAMTVAVDEVSGVGRMVLPGDRVDIIALLEEEQEERRLAYAALVVQNVRVLAVGQVLETDDLSVEASTISLEITPEEALRLALAADQGAIKLLLRGVTDPAPIFITPFTADDFL